MKTALDLLNLTPADRRLLTEEMARDLVRAGLPGSTYEVERVVKSRNGSVVVFYSYTYRSSMLERAETENRIAGFRPDGSPNFNMMG